MKEQNAKKWFQKFILIQLGILLIIVAAVVIIDPYFHYHKPLKGISYRLYEERYINDGISRNFEYNAIITGSSMTQNFKTSEFDTLFSMTAVKEPFSGSGFEELADNLERAFSYNPAIEMVLMCLDYNGLNRDYDWKQYEDYPEYLYDQNIFNDTFYVLNKDILYRGCFSNLYLTLSGENSTTFDEYSAWGAASGFSYITKSYTRKEEPLAMQKELSAQEQERICENIEKNILPLLEEHPETAFYFFFPPYSILYWDSLFMEGEMEKQLAAEQMAIDMLLAYDNVHLFSFFENTELVMNLENYRDKEHYVGSINSYLLEQMSLGNYEITKENKEEYAEFMRDFYLNFDYEGFWEENMRTAEQ